MLAFIQSTQIELETLAQAVVDSLNPATQPSAEGFFSDILKRIRVVESEAAMAELFFELSTTAFRGFTFTDRQSELIDSLLGAAEDIAAAMSASSDKMH